MPGAPNFGMLTTKQEGGVLRTPILQHNASFASTNPLLSSQMLVPNNTVKAGMPVGALLPPGKEVSIANLLLPHSISYNL